jgi:hypothetical protein
MGELIDESKGTFAWDHRLAPQNEFDLVSFNRLIETTSFPFRNDKDNDINHLKVIARKDDFDVTFIDKDNVVSDTVKIKFLEYYRNGNKCSLRFFDVADEEEPMIEVPCPSCANLSKFLANGRLQRELGDKSGEGAVAHRRVLADGREGEWGGSSFYNVVTLRSPFQTKRKIKK